jgi:hypothetical protein
MWKALAAILILLSGCCAAPESPDAHSWYPGVSNPTVTPQQQMEMIQTYNNDWAAEREREQQIWNRLQSPPPVYVRPW